MYRSLVVPRSDGSFGHDGIRQTCRPGFDGGSWRADKTASVSAITRRRRCASEDDGWLVGTFLDYVGGLTGIAVFDTGRVADGPVARAWLEYPLPLAFHGEFSPA